MKLTVCLSAASSDVLCTEKETFGTHYSWPSISNPPVVILASSDRPIKEIEIENEIERRSPMGFPQLYVMMEEWNWSKNLNFCFPISGTPRMSLVREGTNPCRHL